jgi:hypothetical protein
MVWLSTIPRIPECMSLRRNWVLPPPLPQAVLPPPLKMQTLTHAIPHLALPYTLIYAIILGLALKIVKACLKKANKDTIRKTGL